MTSKISNPAKSKTDTEKLKVQPNSTINPLWLEQSQNIEEPVVKVQSHKYYFQVHISNLYDYFSIGLIIPANLIKDRTEIDIQSEYPNNILLSNGYFNLIDKSQCLIEIVLKNEEINDESNVQLLQKPIPITRIRRIYVFDKLTIEKITKTASSQDVGYIPSFLFEYFVDMQSVQKPIIPNKEDSSYKRKINAFDRILGLFAFMKNQQLYYTNTTGIISNYSNHFLDALSVVNSQIVKEYPKYLKDEFVKSFKMMLDYNNIDDTQPNSFIIKNIYDDILFDSQLIKIFFDKFSNTIPDKKNLLLDLSANLLNQIGRKNSLQSLLDINEKFFKVAYIFIYGKKGSNDKEILKNLISEELPYYQSEITLALLGLYYGYKELRLSENIDFHDNKVEKLLGTEHNLKFKLDSILDYIIIESVYEFIFNEKSADKNVLAFTPSINPKVSTAVQVKSDLDFEVELDLLVFNCPVFKLKKLNNGEIISKTLRDFPERLGNSLHVVSYIKKYYDEDHYLVRANSGIVFKSEFIKVFENRDISIANPEHFIASTELDRKFNLR
jgi:hypothetical protein